MRRWFHLGAQLACNGASLSHHEYRGLLQLPARLASSPRLLLHRHYHASLTAEEREAVQAEWTNGDVPIIVATIAFGMGERWWGRCLRMGKR